MSSISSIQDAANNAQLHKLTAPDMSVLKTMSAAPSFPFACFGNFGKRLEEMAKAKSCPADYIGSSVLIGFAGVLANIRAVECGPDWVEHPILWGAIVGNPSAGKSQAIDTIAKRLEALEANIQAGHPEQLQRWEASAAFAAERENIWLSEVKTAATNHLQKPTKPDDAITPKKPHRVRLVSQDTTTEKLGDICAKQVRPPISIHDELSAMIGGFDRYSAGRSDRAFYLKAFGSRRHVVERKSQAQPLIIDRLSLAVLGGIQPDKLVSIVLKGDDDGFASRFLFTFPDPVPLRRVNSLPEIGLHSNQLKKFLDLEAPDGPVVIPLTAEAADTFFEARQKCRNHSLAESGLMASAWGKGDGLIARLALTFEYANWTNGPEPLSVSNISIAFAAGLFIEYFMPMAQRCFGIASLPLDLRAAAALARYVLNKKPSEINLRQLRREAGISGLSSVADFDTAAEALVEAVWLFPVTKEGPGRNAKTFTVNPLIFEEAEQ